MNNRTTMAALVATLTLSALLLASCLGTSSHYSARSTDSRFVDRSISVVPVAIDGASALLSDRDRVYVLQRLGYGEGSAALTAVRAVGPPLWSTPLTVPAELEAIEFSSDTEGDSKDKLHMGRDAHTGYLGAYDAPLTFFARDDAIVLVSYRVGENDSVYAILRRFDRSSGALRSSTIIARTYEDRVPTVGGVQFLSTVAPDSASIAISYEAPTDDIDRDEQHVIVTGLDGSMRRTVMRNWRRWHRPTPTVHLASDGSLYFIEQTDEGALLVERNGSEGSVARSEVKAGIRTSRFRTMSGIGDYRAIVESDGSLVVALLVTLDDEAAGVELVRIDRSAQVRRIASFAVTDTLLEREIGDDELEDCYLASVLRTENPAAQYLVMLENRGGHAGYHGRIGGAVGPERWCGPAMILAFDEQGAPVWQRGIAKQGIEDVGSFFAGSVASWRVADGALDAIVLHAGVFLLRRFDLASGRSLMPFGWLPIIGHREGGGEHTRSFTWTGPASLVVAAGDMPPQRLSFIELSLPGDSARAIERR